MNCLLLAPEELDPDSRIAHVDGRRRQHAVEILKLASGDRLRVGLLGGQLGQAEILRLDEEILELRVELDRDPPKKLPLTLVLALPRPPVFRRLLSTIASLGVERLLVVGTLRTEKSFWQSHAVRPEEIRERFLLGLEQAGDSVLPALEFHRYFEGLVSEVLPPLLQRSRGIIAHPDATQRCPHLVKHAVTLFVGPEGGFVDYEVDKLIEVGFEAVNLGERVIRVEPVIPFLIGRLFG